MQSETTPQDNVHVGSSRSLVHGFVSTLVVLLFGVMLLSVFAPRVAAMLAFSTTKNAHIALIFGRGESLVYTDIGSQYFGGILPYNAALARSFFEEAISRDTKNSLAHYQLARVAFVLGDFHAAQEHIAASTMLAPDFNRNYYMQGLIAGYSEDYVKGEAGFKEFIAREPQLWAGYVDLSWLYFTQGKFKEGLVLLEPVATTFKGIPWFENAYGLFLMHNKQYAEAGEQFKRALASLDATTPESFGGAYPGNDPAFYSVGHAQMRTSIESNIVALAKAVSQ